MGARLEAEELSDALPSPSSQLYEEAEKGMGIFAPAPDLARWVRAHFIENEGRFWNPEHSHLKLATIGFLWTNIPLRRQGIVVVGQAEVPQPPKSWREEHAAYSLRQWLGIMPDFIITLYAPYFVELLEDENHPAVLAVIDHELYHCGHAKDRDGFPKFTREGTPKFGMRGHDVEEFVGVVARWGIGAGAGQTRALVEAALEPPLIDHEAAERGCALCGCGARI